MSHRSSNLLALCAGLLATSATSAWAADITFIGQPGSASWNGACFSGPNPPVVPTGTSQLPACGGGANCLHRLRRRWWLRLGRQRARARR